MPVQDFSIQCRHCFEDKYKYNVYNIEEMHMSKNHKARKICRRFFYRCWDRNYCILLIFTRFICKNCGHYRWNHNGMYWLV